MKNCKWCAIGDCPKHPPLAGIGARGTRGVDACGAQRAVDQIFEKKEAQ